MVHAKTRAAVLKAFEDGFTDTPQGAFIGSFSIAVVRILLSSIASDVVPVSRFEEIDVRFLLADSDAVLPEPLARQLLPFRSPGSLPSVMEWRVAGLPSLFTFSSSWSTATPLRAGEGCTIASCVGGYRACDPTQVRIRNGVVYRETYRGWRPVRDLNQTPVCMDSVLSLDSALGIEVECSFGWTVSRWLQVRLARGYNRGGAGRFRPEIGPPTTHIAA